LCERAGGRESITLGIWGGGGGGLVRGNTVGGGASQEKGLGKLGIKMKAGKSKKIRVNKSKRGGRGGQRKRGRSEGISWEIPHQIEE